MLFYVQFSDKETDCDYATMTQQLNIGLVSGSSIYTLSSSPHYLSWTQKSTRPVSAQKPRDDAGGAGSTGSHCDKQHEKRMWQML